MAKKLKVDIATNRNGKSFEDAFGECWDKLHSLPKLKNIPRDRMSKELYFIWNRNKGSLQNPDSEERLLETLRKIFDADNALAILRRTVG